MLLFSLKTSCKMQALNVKFESINKGGGVLES